MNYRTLVQDKINEVQDKLHAAGYPKFHIDFDIKTLKRGVAGVAHIYNRSISISADYIKEHTDRVISITVPHEVCHHYVFMYRKEAKQAHGPEFRQMMRLLGLAGDTRHDMKLVNGPVKRSRTKTRHVYITKTSHTEVLLTPQQHKKQQEYVQRTGKSLYRSRKTGEDLISRNQVKVFK